MQRGVLVACTIGNVVSKTPTIHATFGTFLVPLSESFGWPRAAISAALTIMALTAAVIYPIAGRIADARGARDMLIAGVAMLGLGIAGLSLGTGSLVQFYLTFLLISIFGSIASTPIYSKVIADWFDHGRGTALGISAGLGNGVGSVLFPIVAAIVVAGYGWRMGYVAIGAIVLLIGVPALFALLRDVPRRAPSRNAGAAEPADGLTLREAMHRPHFWLILVAIASGAGCTTAIFSHVVPILSDRGYGIEVGTAVVSIFALTTSAWQIVAGRILDRIQTPRIVMPMAAMAIAGLAMIEFAHGTPALLLAGIFLGIGMGAQYGALPYYIARYFGTRSFGAIIGLMYSAVIIAQGVTPVLLDLGFDLHGSYRTAVLAACVALAAGTVLLLLLPPYRAGDAAREPRLAPGAA